MIEKLKKYKRIIVTGNQRAGTHFISLIAAYETGFLRIVEMDFDVANHIKFNSFLKMNNVIIHCPAMVHLLPELLKNNEETLVVWVNRSLHDIINSRKKTWRFIDELMEREKFYNYGKYSHDVDIAHIKKLFFTEKIQPKFDCVEVDYENFLTHKLSYKNEGSN